MRVKYSTHYALRNFINVIFKEEYKYGIPFQNNKTLTTQADLVYFPV
jgi:hypothetical protein